LAMSGQFSWSPARISIGRQSRSGWPLTVPNDDLIASFSEVFRIPVSVLTQLVTVSARSFEGQAESGNSKGQQRSLDVWEESLVHFGGIRTTSGTAGAYLVPVGGSQRLIRANTPSLAGYDGVFTKTNKTKAQGRSK
jgi:hypothetical protein